MGSRFAKATRKKSKARVALVGPSGAGKTYTALLIARGLVGPEGRIAVIDTERGSASKYAGTVADFDVLDLEMHAPEEYVRAILDATREGFDVLVIDSLSHAWSGRGGALEQVDAAAKRDRGNSFAAWRDVTPKHNALVDAILAFPGHVIATMRAKTEYVVEQGKNGKTAPRKVGTAPVQRDGMEYEFDVCADIDLEHHMIVTKSRCSALADKVIPNAGADVAQVLRAWLDDGVDAPPPATQTRPAGDSLAGALGGAKSPVDDAIELLGLVEDDVTFVAWFEQHMTLFSGPEKRRAWDAAIARAARLSLEERDVRAFVDAAKQRLATDAQKGAAA